MVELKTSYDLACERMIASRYKEEEEKKSFDFIPVPEFEGREDKTIESVGNTDEIKNDREKYMDKTPSTIKVQEPIRINFDDKPLEAYWEGHFLDYGGFARMNRTFVFGLSNRNVRVKINIVPHVVQVNKSTQNELHLLERNEISDSAPKIFGVTVPTNCIGHSGKKILYTMMETSNTLHKDYREKLNLFDEIWIPTNYGKKILEQNNIFPSKYVMPLGVDVGRYNTKSGTMSLGRNNRGFKFLSVFKWSYRKGIDILLKAYLEEFGGDEDVSLILVSRPIDNSNNIASDFNGIRQTVSKSDSELPHICLYSKPVHERDMPKVYNSCNAFVLISRGEGMGLPFLEAGSTGLPIIASNCSGHSDFLNNDNSYLVEPEGYIKAEIGGQMSKMAKLCRFYEGQMFPNFEEGAVQETRQHMRYVYENYEKAKVKADKFKNLVTEEYTWDMAIDKAYNRIKEIERG